MIRFSKEKVLLLHQLITQETGGSVGVRDEGLLESAWKLPFPASAFTPPKWKRAHESAIA